MVRNFREEYKLNVEKNINSDMIRLWRTQKKEIIKYLEELKDKEKIKILELGSGRGFMIKELKGKGFNIIGSDFNPANLKLAKKINKVILKNIDAERISSKDSFYDIVISIELIEHLPNLKKHLIEVKRILKSQGVYIISTPNYKIEKIYNFISRYVDKSHISSQTHKSIKNLLNKEGFSVKFLHIKELTPGQKNKLGIFRIFYPIRFLPKILQPSIICVAKLENKQ